MEKDKATNECEVIFKTQIGQFKELRTKRKSKLYSTFWQPFKKVAEKIYQSVWNVWSQAELPWKQNHILFCSEVREMLPELKKRTKDFKLGSAACIDTNVSTHVAKRQFPNVKCVYTFNWIKPRDQNMNSSKIKVVSNGTSEKEVNWNIVFSIENEVCKLTQNGFANKQSYQGSGGRLHQWWKDIRIL